MASLAFPALARVLFLNPFAAPFLAWRASSDRTVARLIEGTGSNLDAAGLDLYGRLLRTERHVGAAVALMANWDLNPLQRELAGLKIPLTLIAASRDLAVPPRDASAIATIVPSADVIHVRGYGHLAHEEAPAIFAKIIHDAVSR
jgi:magnesium chelatase accessory protein